jgi:hypothetical protein
MTLPRTLAWMRTDPVGLRLRPRGRFRCLLRLALLNLALRLRAQLRLPVGLRAHRGQLLLLAFLRFRLLALLEPALLLELAQLARAALVLFLLLALELLLRLERDVGGMRIGLLDDRRWLWRRRRFRLG